MNFLREYLTEEEIDELYYKFNNDMLDQIKEVNFLKITSYLIQNKIDFINDIVMEYPDLFLIEYSDFISKFETLKQKYDNYSKKLENDITILEELIN